jgi:hypothetical protein
VRISADTAAPLFPDINDPLKIDYRGCAGKINCLAGARPNRLAERGGFATLF